MQIRRLTSRPVQWITVGLAALSASAAGAEPVDQVVPYSGHLDRDGAPVSGRVSLRFRAFTDPNAVADEADPCDGAATPGGEQCVWAEAHPDVTVHNGAFSVRLGRPTGDGAVRRDLAPILRQNQQYFLEVAVSD